MINEAYFCYSGQDGSGYSYRLWCHHLVDALLVLLSQYGQLACLLLFQALQNGLMVAFGGDLQLMVSKSFILLVLHLTGILELFLDLHLQRLQRVKKKIIATSFPFFHVTNLKSTKYGINQIWCWFILLKHGWKIILINSKAIKK